MTLRLSLTWRLTLFYTLASAAVLLGLGWVTSVATNQHFEDLDRATLEDKIHLIQELGARAADQPHLQTYLQDILHSHQGLFVSIQRNGQPLYASADLHIPRPSGPVADDPQAQALLRWRHDGHDYRALGARLPSALPLPGPGPGPGQGQGQGQEELTVWVALDTQHHVHFQHQFRTALGVYVVLATLLSGLLGWLAAHRGLAPLRIMKSRAQAVTSHTMGQRMPVASVPVEMADLAHTLNDMLARLQQDFSRLSEFSSDLAHELRTPLSNLLTETQVTLSRPRSTADYQDVLASNSEELQRLSRMVSDMLLLAKTEHGLALPGREPIAVATEVQALFDFYEALAAEKGLRLERSGEASIDGDRLMLRRALSNLLSNALRHASPHSAVSIHIESRASETRVRVCNQGADISPELLPRLFDRFFRVDKSRAHPDSDGAGLGLAITRAIMEAHGGSIAVTAQGGLTCFCLCFPGRVGGA